MQAFSRKKPALISPRKCAIIFPKDGDVADHHYYYIVKWNFHTEECTYITSTYFDCFQEWVDDIVILQEQ